MHCLYPCSEQIPLEYFRFHVISTIWHVSNPKCMLFNTFSYLVLACLVCTYIFTAEIVEVVDELAKILVNREFSQTGFAAEENHTTDNTS